MKSIIIIGGDKRQIHLKNILTDKGYFTRHINSLEENKNLDRISQYDSVMLPVPVSKDGKFIYSYNEILLIETGEVLENIREGQKVFGGAFSKDMKKYFDEKGIENYDFFSDEEFTVYNAYLTTQGALKLLFDNTDELLTGKKVLVTGYGRVAKPLCQSLKNNGLEVYVSARDKTQKTKAECQGYKVIDIGSLKYCVHLFDFIFNTVPSQIFTAEDVVNISGKYFELASKPFGADQKYFKQNSFIGGGSLPGKFTAYSSAKKIAEFTLRYI